MLFTVKHQTHHKLPQVLVVGVKADTVELLLHTETLKTDKAPGEKLLSVRFYSSMSVSE